MMLFRVFWKCNRSKLWTQERNTRRCLLWVMSIHTYHMFRHVLSFMVWPTVRHSNRTSFARPTYTCHLNNKWCAENQKHENLLDLLLYNAEDMLTGQRNERKLARHIHTWEKGGKETCTGEELTSSPSRTNQQFCWLRKSGDEQWIHSCKSHGSEVHHLFEIRPSWSSELRTHAWPCHPRIHECLSSPECFVLSAHQDPSNPMPRSWMLLRCIARWTPLRNGPGPQTGQELSRSTGWHIVNRWNPVKSGQLSKSLQTRYSIWYIMRDFVAHSASAPVRVTGTVQVTSLGFRQRLWNSGQS